ncbi:pyridoxal phosphate-dependent decarboxylase family protein [Desulfobacula phenolica]|uniref:Glutamate or tyrosine decarboxylase n=1 Tax=Desulfobacula phenolica TaxID=90732 RepID=A0A1H2HTN9_9BACT|nr:aminotransferase class I/II-fold pyridoxal phosphate-dependent enzyme [Desulfobacula phenolica]SDU34898.1 Glutamate or tyrosine decarboxylase [Desulfobacula phenolica]
MEKELIIHLHEAMTQLLSGFDHLPCFEQEKDMGKINTILNLVAEKLKSNYPYHHPLYAGQMLKPPHPVALLSYTLAMLMNPNNHAIDGGIASSKLEKEAVSNIAYMFGWDDFLGHLTSGGTFANLEALWICEKMNPGKVIVASEQAHYTHNRICDVLKIAFKPVPADHDGVMDTVALEKILKDFDVGTVVVTMGTTGCGKIDPLTKILDLQKQYKFRIHIDAAYGGYFKLATNLSAETTLAFEQMHKADSIVVDPHKHGLQPYGCGCILFKDPHVGKFYKHESPYTYFTSDELHLGEISLECSRAGASSVALWATQQYFPMKKGGEFAKNLEKSRHAAIKLFELINSADEFFTFFKPDLDIIVWSLKGVSSKEISKRNRRFFQKAAQLNLHLALVNIPQSIASHHCDIQWDSDDLACLRSCLMKPEHDYWIEKMFDIIQTSIKTLNV